MAEEKGADLLDMEQRDVNDLNNHVKVQFDEIFGEPEGVRSIDCVWRCSYKCFNCTLSCCYKTLTVLCGVPLAFCWACEFACVACCHIWYITPYIRELTINMLAIQKIFSAFLGAFIAPLCETLGLCFSKIAVQNQ